MDRPRCNSRRRSVTAWAAAVHCKRDAQSVSAIQPQPRSATIVDASHHYEVRDTSDAVDSLSSVWFGAQMRTQWNLALGFAVFWVLVWQRAGTCGRRARRPPGRARHRLARHARLGQAPDRIPATARPRRAAGARRRARHGAADSVSCNGRGTALADGDRTAGDAGLDAGTQQERPQVRLATHEVFEQLHRVAAVTPRQHVLSERTANVGREHALTREA